MALTYIASSSDGRTDRPESRYVTSHMMLLPTDHGGRAWDLEGPGPVMLIYRTTLSHLPMPTRRWANHQSRHGIRAAARIRWIGIEDHGDA